MMALISDLILSAEELGNIKRMHWSIENRLHHVLDDTFREDRSPAKKSRNNLSLISDFLSEVTSAGTTFFILPAFTEISMLFHFNQISSEIS